MGHIFRSGRGVCINKYLFRVWTRLHKHGFVIPYDTIINLVQNIPEQFMNDLATYLIRF